MAQRNPRDERECGRASKPKPEQRSPSQIDRDRIVYSHSFRRLGGVTQVVSPSEGHIFHNRLTHSLKVAQVARRIAEKLTQTRADKLRAARHGGLDPDVVEAAALAHDMGHPPFGHVAEEELAHLAEEAGDPDGFEGNAQSFRIVTHLAAHGSAYRGLNLTRACLRAILKYPWLKGQAPLGQNPKKFGCYGTESARLSWAQQHQVPPFRRSLEAEVMDFADDITYSVHDLDDFYRAGMVALQPLLSNEGELDKFLADWVAEGRARTSWVKKWRPSFRQVLRFVFEQRPYTGQFEQRVRFRTISSALIQKFVFGVRLRNLREPGNLLHCDDRVKAEIEFLKRLVWVYVIKNPRLGTQQAGQREIIRRLFQIYLEAVEKRRREIVTPVFHDVLDEIDLAPVSSEERRKREVRLAVDIVASLTDQQASMLFRRFTGVAIGSLADSLEG